ncbi:MAG: hypothetical protein MJZ20_04690 [Bacteroidaceae bacterium]|nr:hypothetical protein [Bacteroidaceae bacterium]
MPNCIPDENILQSYPASCAIKCQQIILRDYGIDVSEEDLCRIAKENGWYDENVGVYMHDNGKLLGCFGVDYEHSQGNNIANLKVELELCHRVMVSLNKVKLDGYMDPKSKALHAVIVTSIELDVVNIINPANGILNEEITINTFCKAWGDSHYYMLSTIKRALYKYDSSSCSMIELKY